MGQQQRHEGEYCRLLEWNNYSINFQFRKSFGLYKRRFSFHLFLSFYYYCYYIARRWKMYCYHKSDAMTGRKTGNTVVMVYCRVIRWWPSRFGRTDGRRKKNLKDVERQRRRPLCLPNDTLPPLSPMKVFRNDLSSMPFSCWWLHVCSVFIYLLFLFKFSCPSHRPLQPPIDAIDKVRQSV